MHGGSSKTIRSRICKKRARHHGFLEPQISCESCGNRTLVRQRTAILAAAAIPLCRPVLHNKCSQMSLRSLFSPPPLRRFPAGTPLAPGRSGHRYCRTPCAPAKPGLPGKVTIIMGGIAPGPSLPPCTALEAYTPPGARPMGKTQVGVRCLEPKSWNVRPGPCPRDRKLCQRRAASDRRKRSCKPEDLVVRRGRTRRARYRHRSGSGRRENSAQLGGRRPTPTHGTAPRPLVIRQGQTVRVVSRGAAFPSAATGRPSTMQRWARSPEFACPADRVIQGTGNR